MIGGSILTILFLSLTIMMGNLYTMRQEASHKEKQYKPDWEDLDTRVLPEWYDRAKIGIFIHWGVFSVPSVSSEWFWMEWHNNKTEVNNFMRKYYPPGFTYQDFAPMFSAEFFNPDQWAKLFQKSGAKYVVLTSKHHDGFTLFPSKRSFSWNALDVGPKRDLVRELAASVRNTDLKFGLYHSLYEWFNPIYLEDKKRGFQRQSYVSSKLWPDVKQIVNEYRPSVLWVDGDWEAEDTYWRSTDIVAWLYNKSPVKYEIVVNDRWGIGIGCKHGDFYNCFDRYNPNVLQKHKWENAFTIDVKSWGYRRNLLLEDVFTMPELLKEVVTTVSCGGNALINIGPTKEGTIPLIFQERLIDLGKWLKVNGEAIYNTSPWFHQNDTGNGQAWYTCTKNTYNSLHPTAVPASESEVIAFYAILLERPKNQSVKLRDVVSYLHSGAYNVRVLGLEQDLEWEITDQEAIIKLPDLATLPVEHAWVLIFNHKKLN